MSPPWPALDAILGAPSRTGSVIVTIYGDAILPRGGSLAIADLLTVMRRLGMAEGMVRTAISRLARDGLLVGRRAGRRSAYALTEEGMAQFTVAARHIYGLMTRPWDGRLRIAFPDPGTDRAELEAAGFALLAPGVLLGPAPLLDRSNAAPSPVPLLEASGPASAVAALARRAWPLDVLSGLYSDFEKTFAPLAGEQPPGTLDAMAARIALIHAWRRIALRDPRLPPAMLPRPWPGDTAHSLCRLLYAHLAPMSEAWLDTVSSGSGPLPPGPDPLARFSAGDTPPAATASWPALVGTLPPPQSASM